MEVSHADVSNIRGGRRGPFSSRSDAGLGPDNDPTGSERHAAAHREVCEQETPREGQAKALGATHGDRHYHAYGYRAQHQARHYIEWRFSSSSIGYQGR